MIAPLSPLPLDRGPIDLPGALPLQADANTPAGIKAAAEKFEAIFIRQMLSAARASEFGGDDLFGGPGIEQFNAMQDEKLADIASQSGAFGFAKLIETQLAARLGITPGTEG